MKKTFVGAYWASRRETREQFAGRCLSFLEAISNLPGLGQWFAKGPALKTARMRPLELNVEHLLAFVTTNNNETDGAPIENLGFRVALWNGDNSRAASLSVSCGKSSPLVQNSVILNLPPVGEINATQLALLRQVVLAAIEAWDPDCVIATTVELVDQSPSSEPCDARGWFKYRRGSGVMETDL